MRGWGYGGKRLTTKGTLLQTRSNDKQVGVLSEYAVNLIAESKPLCSQLQPEPLDLEL